MSRPLCLGAFMFEAVLWFLLGAAVTNAGEWFIHKYILHALGKHKNSLWAYHWHEHHAVCDKNNMLDEGNRRLKLQWNPQNKELLTLARILLSQLLFIQSLSNQFKNYNFNRR